MRKAIVTLLVLAALAAVGGLGAAFAAALTSPLASAVNPCPAAAEVTVDGIVVPRGPVAGYCQTELVNAAKIVGAARDLGLDTQAQTVGVMTAIGESGLRNLDYGDAAGPDSRGVFQQRDNGAWGTLQDRMDPYVAATNFFKKLVQVDGWQQMAPTQAAHAVQANTDPNHYARFWSRAQEVVAALSG